MSERDSNGPHRAVAPLTLLPLAIGLAANVLVARPTPTTRSPTPSVAATAPNALTPAVATADAGALSSAALVALDKSIPRLGLTTPESEVLESWDKPAPNRSTLGSCPWYGSEGADRETNQRKNRTDLPASYHAVAFSALTDLEWPRDAPTRRDHWSDEQRAVIRPYEGEAVTVTGFIVALRPQAHNTEATNCEETGEEHTDWHIALVGEAGDLEREAVVVETTPRIKRLHPNWTPDRLKPFVGRSDSVRVSGYLLLDPVHKGHLGKYRRTLWEVHPIHRIEVFQGNRWKDLDDGP